MSGALLTDLYQLTLLQASFCRGMNEQASFEFFVRKLPVQRNFLSAGQRGPLTGRRAFWPHPGRALRGS